MKKIILSLNQFFVLLNTLKKILNVILQNVIIVRILLELF
jgi:hypothetical protein